MSLPTKEMEENIVSVLVRLDSEAKVPGISKEEFGKRGQALTKLLKKVGDDFGQQVMGRLFIDASKQAGHTIGPLDTSIIQKLVELGFKINDIGRGVSYNKN